MGVQRLLKIAILVFGTVMIGSVGFKLLGGEVWTFLDALYMSIITLSTVGFSEVHQFTDTQRVWAMVVISFGIGIVLYAFSQGAEFSLNFDLLRRRGMEHKAFKVKKSLYCLRFR